MYIDVYIYRSIYRICYIILPQLVAACAARSRINPRVAKTGTSRAVLGYIIIVQSQIVWMPQIFFAKALYMGKDPQCCVL